MKLQMFIQEVNNAIEESCQQAVQNLPRSVSSFTHDRLIWTPFLRNRRKERNQQVRAKLVP